MKKLAQPPNHPTAQPPNRPTAWLIISLFFCLFFCSPSLIKARLFSPSAMPIGSYVNVRGRKFIKVNHNNLMVDANHYQLCNTTPFNGNMQDFTSEMCQQFCTPMGADYTYVGTMRDSRDNKTYEVRKFSDGKCWMVDNLAYGGVTDACASRTAFSGNGSATPTNRFGTGTYGDCRNNPGTNYGYLYNWQAAMQHSTAYYNTTYTGPTTNVQGLCPAGWVLPTSNTGGDFEVLHLAAGSLVTGFWQTPGNWKGVFSGRCQSMQGLESQGVYGVWWSSTSVSATHVNALYFTSSAVNPSTSSSKYLGFTIRCLKN